MTASPVAEAPAVNPYKMIGGAEVVRALVERFYDLVESEPAYQRLRALHAQDLTPMRASLAGFLTAWLGGPRDWFAERPGGCLMSLHAQIDIDVDTARQWVEAMGRALADSPIEPALAARINEAFKGMAAGMVRPS
jgi:hemoglobin